MKRYISIIVIILTLCVSCKNKTNSNSTENSFENRLESYLDKCNKNGLSASVLVAKDGDILYSGGGGNFT